MPSNHKCAAKLLESVKLPLHPAVLESKGNPELLDLPTLHHASYTHSFSIPHHHTTYYCSSQLLQQQDNSCALQKPVYYLTHERIHYSKSYGTTVDMGSITNAGDNSKVDVLVVGAGPAG